MPGILKIRGRGRQVRRSPGEMNKLEARYAEHLAECKLMGEIADWKFDAFKLRLAKLCYITVDFAVMMPDGEIQFHEVKAFMEDDAAVKLKVAADKFWWFKFVLVRARSKKNGGGFEITEITPA